MSVINYIVLEQEQHSARTDQKGCNTQKSNIQIKKEPRQTVSQKRRDEGKIAHLALMFEETLKNQQTILQSRQEKKRSRASEEGTSKDVQERLPTK